MYSKEALLKRRAELSAAKQALLTQHLRGELPVPAPLSTTIPKRPALPLIPLSSIQERFWFLQHLDPTSTHYIGVIVYRMTCLLDLPALAQTARQIVRRHEILRTTYCVLDGMVFQRVDPTLHLRLRVPLLDLTALPSEQQQPLLEQIISREQQRPLSLTAGVPWSATLLRLAADHHVLMLRVHHLIGDGWSVDTLVHQELISHYRAYLAGQAAPLPPLPIQYADYAYWQRQRLQSAEFARHRQYWREQLRGVPEALRLPTDYARPAVQRYREANVALRLTEEQVLALKGLGQVEQVTLFMVLLAAFGVLLGRLSGQEEVVVGSSVAGREYPELEGLLGCFINTLPLRLDLSGQVTFRGLLGRVREVCVSGLAHQEVPVEEIIAEVQPARDQSRSVLFQVLFQLQNYPHFPAQPEQAEHVRGRAGREAAGVVVGQGQCDLMLILSETSETSGVEGSLTYDATLFEAATMERMCGQYVSLVEGLVARPERAVMSISLLTPAQRQQILSTWSITQAVPHDHCFPDVFNALVARTPDAVAVAFAEQQLTYQELNRRANHLAHYLQALGVGPEVQVGLCMERSLNLLVGLLGILNAGGAYVPLDPHYPRERLMLILEDTQLALVLTQERLRSVLPDQRARIVCLDSAWPTIAQTPATLAPIKVTGQNLAYVIYTSGATGRPKGVMVQHQSLVTFGEVAGQVYAITPADRVLQFASICFDASAEEIYPCLMRGATLVLRTDSMLDSVAVFLEKCREWALTILDLPTAYWHELVVQLSQAALRLPAPLRLVIIGGERALPERLATWQQRVDRHVRLVNTYGPTEATVVATLAELTDTTPAAAQWQEVPIGRAMPHALVYILDHYLDPVPIGVPGELYIGGSGVARGYLNRPDLTAERFIPNPFAEGMGDKRSAGGGLGWGMEDSIPNTQHPTPNTRLYRTGDRARYLADGRIEFLGRYDRQVKLRGYRIEPGEIEAALARHAAVQAAAVVERADGLGGTQLVAYVVMRTEGRGLSEPESTVHSPQSTVLSELRGFLKEQLPAYMLPAAIMELSALPLTPNGKLDYQALPAPDQSGAGPCFEAPQTAVEQALAEVWGAVLKRERIGRNDNFFALGGHSLLASQLIYRINEVFALALPLRSLFQEPALADLALAIEERWLAEISAHDEPDPLGLQVSWPLPLTASLIDPLLLPSASDAALTTATPEADPARAQRQTELAARQAQLTSTQQALLSSRIQQARSARTRAALPSIPPRPAEAPVPLAFAQEALWLQEQLTPGTTLYNISRVERLHGALDRAALEQSLQTLVQRHEPLRTHFTTVEGQPVQVIAPSVPLTLALLDLRGVPPEQHESAARQFVASVQRPFALDQAPLLRVGLVQLSDDEHVLLITLHHLIADGWSLGVFFRDLTQLYSAAVEGRAAAVAELPVQYGDYAVWQRRWLQGSLLDAQLAYWKQQLAGAPALLALPCDHARPAQASFAGATCRLAVPEAVRQALRQLSQELHATLFMALLAAWQSLLGRLSGQEDIVVGVPVAGRTRPELDGLIGCFINTLALRSDLRGTPTFREFVQRVREVCLEGYAHQDLPFGKLLEVLRPNRTLSHSPLFQVLFDLHNTVTAADVQLDITGTSVEQTTSTVNYDLTLLLHDNVGKLTGVLEYSSELFEATTIERLCGHFLTLLEGIAADPDQRLCDLPLLSAAERQQLLVDWNATAADYPQDLCVQHLFEAQVVRTPDAAALVFADHLLTYQELNHRASQLACYLRSLGVAAEVLTALCVRRSIELAVGMLGILKAGAAYLPLDPDYPRERLAFLLADSQAPVLLTQAGLLPRLPEWGSAPPPKLVCLDRDWSSIAAGDQATFRSQVQPAHTAAVIYTSGSTGQPKGVLLPHRALVNYTLAVLPRFELRAQDRFLQFAALGFDVVLEELLPTWASGATVVLHDAELLSPADTFGQLLVRSGVTVVELPAHYWQAWVYELTQTNGTVPAWLRLVIVGCEQPTPASLVAWQQFGISLIHVYGLSETTITTSLYHLAAGGEAAPPRPLPLGRPIANTQLYVLDPQMQPVPLGVPGELYIGGAGLARGYLHRAELTAERFVPNPFWGMGDGGWGMGDASPSPIPHPPSPGTRLYKTGDLVRYQTDGNIEFLGRYDRQVKLHGYRIELGEIEAALAQHPAVHVAAVVQRADRLGGTQLVAYVVMRTEGRGLSEAESSVLSPQSSVLSELRGFLKEQLPTYMLPAAYVMLEALPLTPNGKLDHRALPLLDLADTEQAVPFVAPRSPTEEAMAEIWKQILGLERVGVHDNFFDLGGHSILMSQLMFKVQEVFLVDLPWRSLFEAPTVADLTRAVELARVTGSSGIATKETAIDLNAEVVLDPSISAKGPLTSPVTATGSIFLTGASGFLGAFLLHELLQRTSATVYCLVRAPQLEEGSARLQSALENYLLWDEQFSARMIPVLGDLAKPRLGLAPREFERIANTVETIYHNGALVNFLYPYKNLKPANVLGTQEVLRMASLGSVKPVHYISTLSVIPAAEPSDERIREHDPLPHSHKLEGGYAQSKWVAEQLVALAHTRGIPVSIYRPGHLTGDSQTGACNPNDLFGHLLKSSIQMGGIPNLDTQLEWTPVDYVSKAIVHLAQQPDSYGRTYHLFNPQRLPFSELVAYMQRRGYPLRLLEPEQWRQELVQALNNSQENALHFLSGPLLEQESSAAAVSEEGATGDEPEIDCQATLDALATSGIACPAIDAQILDTYFTFFTRTKFLDTPAVETQST